jgi:hypothetical protein
MLMKKHEKVPNSHAIAVLPAAHRLSRPWWAPGVGALEKRCYDVSFFSILFLREEGGEENCIATATQYTSSVGIDA